MRIFFASDIHGSETCFRKFINAGNFYGVDCLIMGGDLAGKELVPLVPEEGQWIGRFRGSLFTAGDDQELIDLERRLAGVGAYSMRTTSDFVEELREDQELVESTLKTLIMERTERWMDLASERLSDTGIDCLIGLGNDDFDELIPLFDRPPVRHARDGLMELGEFTLGSVGWSNVTPWRTNRECTEEEMASKMRDLEDADPGRAIYNIHVPPYDSGLDAAPRLDENLQIQLVGGEPDMVPVGSTAVSEGLERSAPLLSLHGHIHEGRGVVRSGKTTVVNPGSEYDQGVLLGVIIDVKPGKVKTCQLVTG